MPIIVFDRLQLVLIYQSALARPVRRISPCLQPLGLEVE